jgi:S1-C subfamily serine protease
MNKRIISYIIILIFNPWNTYSQNKLTSEEIFKKCSKSVVTIYINKNGKKVAGASGVCIKDGYLATNYHVLKSIADINGFAYLKNGDTYLPLEKYVCYWEKYDLAILKITEGVIPSISIGNSNNINTGATVCTISSPSFSDIAIAQSENSITPGLISNKIIDKETNQPVRFQTSAQFTHGSSGGALINEFGELIGILQGGYDTEDGARANINFAIPINFLIYLASSDLCKLDLTSTLNLKSKSNPNLNSPKNKLEIKEEQKGLQENPGEVNIE